MVPSVSLWCNASITNKNSVSWRPDNTSWKSWHSSGFYDNITMKRKYVLCLPNKVWEYKKS